MLKGTWRLALAALLVALLGLPTAVAQGPQEDTTMIPGQEAVQGVRPLYDDGGAWEVGSHAAAGGSLTAHAYHEAWGVSYKLGTCGWNRRYVYNKYLAWEEDFKRAALGGKEHVYLDTVDLQFYVGHGGPSGFTFWNTCCDDYKLTTNDCYRSWGNDDNEWVALTSCNVLADSNLAAWARCMRGTHLILGFKSTAYARYPYYNTQGYWFARYLCQGYTVPQAWYKAGDRVQRTKTLRILYNEVACQWDRPKTGWVCADSYDWDAWVSTHYACGDPAGYVDVGDLDGTMPRFAFRPFSTADAGNKYDRLGGVFEVPVTPTLRIQQDEVMWADMSDGRELEMDSQSGLYGYMDLNNMWAYTPTLGAHEVQGVRITANGARDIADRFLTDNNLMPGDAQFSHVVSDTMSGGDIVSGTLAAMNASLLANEEATVWQVIYSRVLTYTPPSIAGVAPQAQAIAFSVVGPGAKQKVYVPTNASMLSANGLPPGAMGGWRELLGQQGSSVQAADTVEMLTPDQIYMLHDTEDLAKMVVLDPSPIQADEAEILTHTVAYWEEGAGASQAELTPVYELTVRYTLGGEEVAVDQLHIPANETYMSPFAKIESAPTEMVKMGQTITLTATEAATTLAVLGYDPSLDFVLGSGAPEDYIYEWYVNSVEEANKIRAGRSITYTVTGDVSERPGGTPQQTIILKVTDWTNPDQHSNTDSATLDIYARIFMPVIMKNWA